MTRSLSSNFLKDYDTNGIVRHLRNKGCKGWGLSEELGLKSKIQQTKMLVTCQMFDDLFLFWLVWQYSSVQTKYNKGRFKVMATYLQQ